MCSNSPKVRLRIDWDADGAFAALTRPGEAAEEIRLSLREVQVLLRDLLGAALAGSGRAVVQPSGGNGLSRRP